MARLVGWILNLGGVLALILAVGCVITWAQIQKGERARLADRIARPLVPGVITLAALVGVIGVIFSDPETWITRALVVLVAASPCALALAVPITVLLGVGAASKFGVIIKSGAAFEQLGSIRHLAVDKTGTLTRNEPTVTSVITHGDASEAEVRRAGRSRAALDPPSCDRNYCRSNVSSHSTGRHRGGRPRCHWHRERTHGHGRKSPLAKRWATHGAGGEFGGFWADVCSGDA